MCIGSVSQPDVTLSACQPIDGECKKTKIQKYNKIPKYKKIQKINEYKYNTNCQPIDGECKKAKMQNTIKYKNSMNGYEKETWLFAFWLFVQRYFTSVPACLFL